MSAKTTFSSKLKDLQDIFHRNKATAIGAGIVSVLAICSIVAGTLLVNYQPEADQVAQADTSSNDAYDAPDNGDDTSESPISDESKTAAVQSEGNQEDKKTESTKTESAKPSTAISSNRSTTNTTSNSNAGSNNIYAPGTTSPTSTNNQSGYEIITSPNQIEIEYTITGNVVSPKPSTSSPSASPNNNSTSPSNSGTPSGNPSPSQSATQSPSQPSTPQTTVQAKPNATAAEIKPEAIAQKSAQTTNIYQILTATNQYRAEVGAGELVLDEDLTTAAMVRAIEIAWANKFSHTRPNGSICFTVAGELGITPFSAENIALSSSGNGNTLARLWRESAGHYANMITAEYTKIGIGVYNYNGDIYGVQLFR